MLRGYQILRNDRNNGGAMLLVKVESKMEINRENSIEKSI